MIAVFNLSICCCCSYIALMFTTERPAIFTAWYNVLFAEFFLPGIKIGNQIWELWHHFLHNKAGGFFISIFRIFIADVVRIFAG